MEANSFSLVVSASDLWGSSRETLVQQQQQSSMLTIAGAVKGHILAVLQESVGGIILGLKCHCSSIFLPRSTDSLALGFWLRRCCQRIVASLRHCLAPKGSKCHSVSLALCHCFHWAAVPYYCQWWARRSAWVTETLKNNEENGRFPVITDLRKLWRRYSSSKIFFHKAANIASTGLKYRFITLFGFDFEGFVFPQFIFS